MEIITLLPALILIIIILLFTSKTLSPIPYFPSQKSDLPQIIEALDLKDNQTMLDLGAGDGLVVFEAAKSSYDRRLNTRYVAVEINIILVLIMIFKRIFHPNRKNIIIVYGDIFKPEFIKNIKKNNSITVYLYISPWYLNKVIKNLKTKMNQFKIVSYMYPLQNQSPDIKLKGKNTVYIYRNFSPTNFHP